MLSLSAAGHIVYVRPTEFPIALDAAFRGYAIEILTPDTAACDWPPVEIVEMPVPATIARAAPRRIAAFVAGRYCAQALGLGADLPVGPDGAPSWPATLVGSITHADRFAAAVVAPVTLVGGVGLDCERIIAADAAPAIAERVCPELATSDPALITLAFSAKESLYKCYRPLVGKFFGFDEARVTDVSTSALRLQFRGMAIEAACAIRGDHVYTLISRVPASQISQSQRPDPGT
jgi:4'-phosphopantetheinyl transferase EntD